MEKLLLIIIMFSFFSCTTQKIKYFENRSVVNDEYVQIDFTLQSADTTLVFSENYILPLNISIPVLNGNDVNYHLWHSPFHNDISKLLICIPGLETDIKLFYPIAFELVKNGYSICFMDLREKRNSFNQKLTRSRLNNEITDLEMFIEFYKEQFEVENLNIAIYGISVGGVIGLNYINSTNENIKSLITEGLPYNLQSTYNRLHKKAKKEFHLNEDFFDYSFHNLITSKNNTTSVYSIWGKDDELITYNEIQQAINKLEQSYNTFDFHIYDSKFHTFRAAINQNMYFEINEKIINLVKLNL